MRYKPFNAAVKRITILPTRHTLQRQQLTAFQLKQQIEFTRADTEKIMYLNPLNKIQVQPNVI